VYSHKKPADTHTQFANVGNQIQNIDLIGGKGIAAIASAKVAQLEAFVDEPDPDEPVDPDPVEGYGETDYKTTVAVAMSLTSVQKDLKIKFSNRETNKLVGNVQFIALVTKPDGTTEEWMDDDMDGIIYTKGIEAGKYSVSLKALDADKYSNYILPSSAQTLNVKKNIEYAKVDVTGEGKKESEINVSQEDTKKNETANEGGLTDTVTWVASSVTGNTYTEVLKSTIPDPLTRPIVVAKNFYRTAQADIPGTGNEGEGGSGSGEGGSGEGGSGSGEGGSGEGGSGTGTETQDPSPSPDPPAPTKYTVSYNANGGSGSMNPDSVDAGTTFTLPGCGFTAPEGKEFAGWDCGASILVDGDKTVTATWKDKPQPVNYTIRFSAGEGSGSMADVTKESGSSYSLPECGFTAPEGKVFDKWDLGAVGTAIAINGDVTVTALWKTKEATSYKISFAAGEGGSGSMADVTVSAGEYTLPACGFTAPEGKVFDKWDKGAAGAKITVSGDVTLTAQWKSATTTTPIVMKTDKAKLELVVNKQADGTTKTTPGAINVTFESAKTAAVIQVVSTDNNVATAKIDDTDKKKIVVTAVGKGTAKIMITADYEDAANRLADGKSQVVKEVEVVVTEKAALAISLNQAEILCFGDPQTSIPILEVTIKNSSQKPEDLTEAKMTKFVATISDANMATISKKEFGTATADGSITIKLYISPAVLTEKKSGFINVSYQEEGSDVITGKCTLTIKPHPKNDKTTPLLDKDDKPLFVENGNQYRQAVYADYYVEGTKFYLQSGVKYTGWQTIDNKVFYFDVQGKPVTGEQVIQGAKYTFGADGALSTGNGVLGIDVSRWNGSIDWAKVKNSGVSYVIIRCGYRGSSKGQLIEDPKFTTNIKGAINAGLKVGVYFFTQATDEVEAVYEASYVIDKIKNYKISYPVFLDVEPSGGRGDKISSEMRTNVCKAFCQTIQNAGYTAGIYANKTWLTEKLDASQLSAYKIWLAQYAAAPTYNGRYDMWQYKSTGSINGISGDVDMNLSYMGY
ncbi:MAG: InlB B-repeat-containing protein, partial [Lachnospiraceae bacterium]|nr:InlB B-repeat-containing protein [Lachnospiraceae bacterium]